VNWSAKKLLLLLFLTPSLLLASGTLKGVVRDSTTGQPLVAANVMLVGTPLGTAGDISGNYTIQTIPAGHYNARCSYVGYLSQTISVTIKDDKATECNFALLPTAVQGQEVVITSQALGQAAAINQQLTSNAIVSVVSEEKIKELPDANAAEAIGRLPGVSVVRSGGEANQIVLRGLSEDLTTITMDGVQLSATDADSRGVDLSTIAQASLSGITVTKAITSDMDGQAIAGNVNFVTKTAPETRVIQVTAQGSYAALTNSYSQYNFNGNYGERFFDDVVGIQIFANAERRDRSSEDYNVAYDQTLNNSTKWGINSFTLDWTPEIRTRTGGRVLFDFKTPDDGVIKVNGDFNTTQRRLSQMTRDYPVESSEINYDIQGQDINTDISAFSVVGENNVSDWHVSWNFSFTQSSTEQPYNYTANFDEPSTLNGNNQVVSGMLAVPPSLWQGPYQALIPYSLNNFSDAFLQYGYIRTESNLEFQRTATLDIKRDYLFSDISGEFKFGGKYTDRYHRRDNMMEFSPYYNSAQVLPDMLNSNGQIVAKDWAKYGFGNLQDAGGLVLLTNFLTSGTRNIYGLYNFDPLFDPTLIRNWYDISSVGITADGARREYADGTAEDGTGYTANEAVGAGYLMNTLNFGTAATFIAGVRLETDDDSYTSYYTPQPLTVYSVFSDTAAKHTETIVLPNFHFIVRPTDYLNVRLAAYAGIIRPDFNYRLPTYVIVGTAPYVDNDMAKVGNTNLKNGDAWNYELNIQAYGNDLGLLSFSTYYKRIKNEIELLNGYEILPGSTTPAQVGMVYRNGKPPFASMYLLTYPYNSTLPTEVWGFELEQQTNLRFLPGYLRGLTMSYNLSLVKDQTYTPFAETKYDTVILAGFKVAKPYLELAEQRSRIVNSPEFFGNAVLGYDIAGFSVRLSYFYQGQYYNGFSVDNRSNPVQDAFSRLDLALKQNIGDHLAVGLNINNLTDASEGTSIQNTVMKWTLLTSSIRYGTTADLWMRVLL